MILKSINGWQMEKMLRNGLACLEEKKNKINDMNVFPVPDGDTGTNMYLTLEHGLEAGNKSGRIDEFMKSVSDGALLGARGNSGVILSQILNGMGKSLAGRKVAGAEALRQALVSGCQYAYGAVVTPVEGTILTVIREGIGAVSAKAAKTMSINELLDVYIEEMQRSLTRTPELLPTLKRAGVVDSGAYGYIVIVIGMIKYLAGDINFEAGDPVYTPNAGKKIDAERISFGADSAFDDGYCMEFILQLMNSENYEIFNRDSFISALQPMGNSLVVVHSDTRVKVHIHTKKPAGIISYSQKFGEFIDFKLENMQIQHNERNEYHETRTERKKLAMVSVVDSEKMQELFYKLGCSQVINGGASMNVPVEKFIEVFKETQADNIIVLPNNKNTVFAARQAAEMYAGAGDDGVASPGACGEASLGAGGEAGGETSLGACDAGVASPGACGETSLGAGGEFGGILASGQILIVPTESIPEGYFALSLDMSEGEEPAGRAKKMQRNYADIQTLFVTAASKNFREDVGRAFGCRNETGADAPGSICTLENATVPADSDSRIISCEEGDMICLADGHLWAVGEDSVDALVKGLEKANGIEDMETLVVFRGILEPVSRESRLIRAVGEKFPDLEVSFIDGGSPLYNWCVAVF